MVRNALLSSSLQGFYGIIEEEVDQDGINLGLGMLAHNLPPDQLYTPDTATCNTPFQSAVTHSLLVHELTSQLHLPVLTRRQVPLLPHGDVQRRAVRQTAQAVEHLRHAVVGEHGDLVDVPEGAVALALEAGPDISDENLGSLEQPDGLLAPLEAVLIPEAPEVLGQQVDQAGGRAVGGGDEVGWVAVVFLGIVG